MERKRDIGAVIKKQRISLGLSLQQLSRMSGVSASFIDRIETGERVPSIRTLQMLAEPLSFDLEELLIAMGHLSPKSPSLTVDHRSELRAELKMLQQRVEQDNKRIKEIIDRLLMSA